VPADGTTAATVGNGNVGTSPFFGQVWGKRLLAHKKQHRVSSAKRKDEVEKLGAEYLLFGGRALPRASLRHGRNIVSRRQLARGGERSNPAAGAVARPMMLSRATTLAGDARDRGTQWRDATVLGRARLRRRHRAGQPRLIDHDAEKIRAGGKMIEVVKERITPPGGRLSLSKIDFGQEVTPILFAFFFLIGDSAILSALGRRLFRVEPVMLPMSAQKTKRPPTEAAPSLDQLRPRRGVIFPATFMPFSKWSHSPSSLLPVRGYDGGQP